MSNVKGIPRRGWVNMHMLRRSDRSPGFKIHALRNRYQNQQMTLIMRKNSAF